MRTFAQRPEAAHQAKPMKSTKSSPTHSGPAHDIHSTLQPQRAVGNQAIQRLLWAEPESRETASNTVPATDFDHDFSRMPVYDRLSTGIQPKLTVSTAGDKYEQEADSVAERIVNMPDREIAVGRAQSGDSTHKAGIGQNAHFQAKSLDGKTTSAEHRSESLSQSYSLPADNSTSQSLAGGESLSPSSRDFFEPRFGQSFHNVKVHTDDNAARMARSINASAFTFGNNIVFGAGQYQPDSHTGRRLLGHELTHVLQQSNHRAGNSLVQTSSLPSANIVQRKACDPLLQDCPEGMACFPVNGGFECLMTPQGEFSELVEKILKPAGTTIEPDDEKKLKGIVDSTTDPQLLKEYEKIIVLWPKHGRKTKKAKIIDIVTNALRKSILVESQRGRFSEKEGGYIKSELDKDVQDRLEKEEQKLIEEHEKSSSVPLSERDLKLIKDKALSRELNSCLDFVNSNSIERLYEDEEDRLESSKLAYAEGQKERKVNIHKKTGSRLASELRLQGLVGPINLLNWKGSDEDGSYVTPPVDLFDDLSGAGDGWYFFIVALFSYHTFTIAVHVTKGGTRRKYFKIQGGSSISKSRSELTDYMNDGVWPPHGKNVGTRIWQVYASPVAD